MIVDIMCGQRPAEHQQLERNICMFHPRDLDSGVAWLSALLLVTHNLVVISYQENATNKRHAIHQMASNSMGPS